MTTVPVGRRHRVDHGVDRAEVRVPGVRGRRADRDEQQPRVLERVGDVGREVQAAAVLRDEVGEAGLVDRDLAALQAVDLRGVDVDAPDVVAELREAGRGHEADVAGADDTDGFARAGHERRTRIAGASGVTARGRSPGGSCALSARRPGSATGRSRASAGS
jgi:hypothetical protein